MEDCNKNLVNQASNIWTMLDDMAENDPNAYRKFIDKKITEGREYMKPSEPHMCVKTNILSPVQSVVFVNFCGWYRVPEPKSEDAPIPVCGGDFETSIEPNGEKCRVVPVAFNPNVLEDYGREAKDSEHRKCLIDLAFNFIQDMHEIKLSWNYTILGKDVMCKGTPEKCHQSLLSRLKGYSGGKSLEDDISTLSNSFAPLSSFSEDTMLSQLGNIVTPSQQGSSTERNSPLRNGETMTTLSTSPISDLKGLIEEIKGSEVNLPEPEYELNTSVAGNDDQVIIRIILPDVQSVSECELDISEDDLSLEVRNKYYLYLRLPVVVDDSSARAKFHSKTCVLMISLSKKQS